MKPRHFPALALALVLICGMAFAQETKSDGATHVDVTGAEKLIKDDRALILDVRSADEFKSGHIAGAKNIDFTENDFEQKASELDKSRPWLVHCGSGRRSTASLEVLQKLGFKQLYHLDGGMKAWQAAGKPVEK
jgi:phage shock protein E